MPLSKAELAAQQSALDLYLRVKQAGDSQIPTLDAALFDARVTMAASQALWLATAGYLIVIEMIGQTVARSSTKFRDRGTSTACFKAGAREFASRTITADDAEALYAVRCALVHEYSLRSVPTNKSKKTHYFAFTELGALISHPTTSSPIGAPTVVNVREVGIVVEELVQNVRDEHARGLVRVAPGMTPLEIRNFGQFVITP